MVVYRSVAIEKPRPAAAVKASPWGKLSKKALRNLFLTEEGTQVRIFRLVSNFRCSTLYPPFGVLSPKGKAWVLPHQWAVRYIPFFFRSNESSGPDGVATTTAIRHEKSAANRRQITVYRIFCALSPPCHFDRAKRVEKS